MTRIRWVVVLLALLFLLAANLLWIRSSRQLELAGAESTSAGDTRPATAELPAPEAGATSETRRQLGTADGPTVPSSATATLILETLGEEDEQPISGVHLGLRWASRSDESQPFASLESDAQGRAKLVVEAGREIRVDAFFEGRNGAATIAELVPGETRTERVMIHMLSELVFWCRVLRDEDGARQAFVPAELVWRETAAEGGLHRENRTTDAEGLVQVQSLDWREAALLVELPGFAQAAVPIGRGHETPEQAFELRLFRAARLNVLVTDPAGTPRPGLVVRAEASAYELSQSDFWFEDAQHVRTVFDATSDSQGRASLEGLPAQVELELSVLAGEVTLMREPTKLRLERGEERAATLVVGGTAVLAGRAIDQSGEVVPDQELWMSEPDPSMGMVFRDWSKPHARARTDAQGRFEFLDVAEGEWWVGPAGETQAPRTEAALAAYGQRIVIPPGAGRAEVVLRLWRGLYLRGHVQLASGERVPACPVSAHAPDEEHTGYLNARTGEDGSFSLGPVCGVEYELVAGGAFQSNYSQALPLHVRGGNEGLVLIVERAASLHGTVIDPETGEACDGMIHVTQANVREGFARSLITQTRARAFEVKGIAPGVWDVCMRARNGALAATRITLAPGESKELELRVGPSVTLVFTNAGADTCHVVVESDGLAIETALVNPAEEKRFLVPAGRTTLRVLDTQGRHLARRALEIAAGAQGELRHPEGK